MAIFTNDFHARIMYTFDVKLFAILALGIFGVIGTFLSIKQFSLYSSPKKTSIRVATSFYPLYFFAKAIGGHSISVTNITPAGAEPHDYELSTRDIRTIEQSGLLVTNGLIEPWLDTISTNLQGKKTTIVVAGQGLFIDGDPHIWLDPMLAKKEAAAIRAGLSVVDPTNIMVYQSNEQKLDTALDELDSVYRQGLRTCRLRTFIASHAAFGYLAARYNLKELAITGLSPDSEPSPKELAALTKFAKDNGVSYIFFEALVSPRLANTLAREVGAKTLVLNPLEGLTKEEESQGKDYFSIQKDNLENLKKALQCQ